MLTLVEKINGWHPVGLSIMAFMISFTNIEMWLRVCTLSVALGYSIWKWYVEYKKKK